MFAGLDSQRVRGDGCAAVGCRAESDGLGSQLDPAVDRALTSSLRKHRDFMMETYFEIPMVM